MTVTEKDLQTTYAFWFRGLKNSKKAKEAILALFAEEPDEFHVWTEQDICEQSRKIIEACEKAEKTLNRGSAPNPGV